MKEKGLVFLLFILSYELMENCYGVFVNLARYVNVKHSISWVFLTILICFVLAILYYFIFKIFDLGKTKQLIILISAFVLSYISLIYANYSLGLWFGHLTKLEIQKVYQADSIVAYSNVFFNIIIIIYTVFCISLNYIKINK